MILKGQIQKIAAIAFVFSLFSSFSEAKDHQIQVRLFGNLCLLRGPFDEDTLKSVHAISPEQLPPSQSADQLKQQIQKISAANRVPNQLTEYKEKIRKRLEALAGFFDAMSALKQDTKSDALWIAGKKYVPADRIESFESSVKSIIGKDTSKPLSSAVQDQIKETYERFIEADPQEEFHRTIQKMKIGYDCSFEESEGE